MVNLEISVRETVREELARAAARLARQRPLHARWAQSVAIRMRTNARAKGGRRLWREIADATRVDRIGEDGASIGVHHPAAHMRHTGGEIRAKNVKALTIPIAPEAEGKRAGEFELGGRDLFVLRSRSSDPSTIGILGFDEGDVFHPLYLLRAKVTHPADPWLPTDDEVAELGLVEATQLLAEAMP